MLTLKQQAFVRAFYKCHNRTQAAKEAGASPRSAYSTGCRWLKNAEVAAAIRELEEAADKAAHYTVVDARKRLAAVAESDPKLTASNLAVLARISGWETAPTQNVNLKLEESVGALNDDQLNTLITRLSGTTGSPPPSVPADPGKASPVGVPPVGDTDL